MKRHRAFSPDKPFFMYWAPGAAHGPHHIFKEWADKYKGKFDDGWDAHARAHLRAPEGARLDSGRRASSRRAPTSMAAWDSIPESERPFQRRLMEVFAGFVEHVDAQAGKVDRRARRARHPRQHDRPLHLGRQRLERRGPERQHQRAAGAEPDPEHRSSSSSQALSTARRARRARRSEDRQHVPRRLGVGRRHAVPLHQADRLALRRHAQSAGRSPGRRASSPTRRRGRSSTTSTTSCRRSTRSSASSRRRSSTASSRIRSTAPAWSTRSPTRRRPGASTPSTSTTTAAAASTTTAGTPARSAR